MSLRQRLIKEFFRFLIVFTLVLPVLGTGRASADTTWTQTSQANFQSGTLNQVEAASSPGDVKLAKTGTAGNFVYSFYGSTTSFARYDIAGNSWLSLTAAPANVGAGASLAYDGGDYVYALRGASTNAFWRYSISGNNWTVMANTTSNVGTGGSLTFDGGSYIYALCGNSSKAFLRYTISSNTWTAMANTPNNIGAGGSLVYDNSSYLYALRGNSSTFWRYSIAGNTWTAMASTPSSVGAGASLAYDGSAYIYALRGNNQTTYWRYSISGNSWTVMTSTPSAVRDGGALTYNSAGNIYATRGNTTNTFWRYSVSGNSWTAMTNALATVTTGGALARGGSAYYTSGDLTSAAHDTGCSANFSTLFWTAVTPACTSVKFQIATNNDSGTWVFKGPDGTAATYYTTSSASIWSGHSGSRYIKYKAFFSTTNTVITPVLNDVSIVYTQCIVLPSATTNPATLVEETTATLNGIVVGDGGESCQYQFVYGTTLGGPYPDSTGWTGSLNNGQTFSASLTGLTQGTKYYFQAQVKNSAGTGSGAEQNFLTKPEAPTSLMASAVSGTQINLSWNKGTGANRTRIMRKIGSYPTDYNDGTEVYFNTGTSASDTGLTPGTTYYYRAWSEVTVGSSQQWSDTYTSATASTSGAPSATTDPATLVEETTATLNGSVAGDGGESCQSQFIYGTTPGGPYPDSTGWTGSLTNGQTFSVSLTDLSKGTKYYFQAQVKNSAGTGSGGESEFLTKPDPPLASSFTASVVSDTQITLSWTKGEGAQKTLVMRQTGGFPADRNDGVQAYFDTGTSFTDTGLSPGTTYYYRTWSQVSGSEQWSDTYQELTASTSPAPTTPPAVVGGPVFPINKMKVLAPYLGAFLALLLIVGGALFQLARIIKRA